ncbi:hypothetical protein Tco_1457006 [Tanacetum coccineum]
MTPYPGSGSEDLEQCPSRRTKPNAFHLMITRFQYHRKAKLHQNVSGYVTVKTLKWLGEELVSDSLEDPKSVDGFEELSSKFLEEFSQQKRYDKDPTEIHGIKRKPNEGLQAFMDRFKAESAHIKGVPPVLRISAFMHGHGHPELSKKLNDKIPKTADEMWERVRAFIRGEAAADTTEAIRSPRWEKSAGKASWSEHQNGSRNRSHRRGEGRNMGTCAPYARREGFTPLRKTPKEILAMDNVNFPPPPPMVGTPEKRNMNKFCDYHQDRGHNTNDCYHLKKQIEEAVASGRLAHLVKIYRQGRSRRGKGSAKGREKVINMVRSQVEAVIEGFRVRRIHVDGGSSSEVMYEHCSREVLSYRNAVRGLRDSRKPLDVDEDARAVASTIHSMMKFPTSNGIATISTTRENLRECRQIEEAQT